MKKITAVVVGAGQRGNAYSQYAIDYPNKFQVVAVAEPDDERRELFLEKHSIEGSKCFKSWKDLMEQPQMADAAIICTQDNMHTVPAIKALEKGYHVLLEKPMSNDVLECIAIGEYAGKYKRILSICHVLRYTSFYIEIKRIIDEGKIGSVVAIQQTENVGYWHQAHSYVRGNWSNSKVSSPMILAKSCHDMDILLWLAGSDCKKVSSFGSLTHFRRENAPKGSPKRCLDGCPAIDDCPFYAPDIYVNREDDWIAKILRPIISTDTSKEGLLKALKVGPYGRCVYHCDNDVVDHQVVNIEFENQVTASFTMCAFTNEGGRTLKIMGTKGEIRGHMEHNEIMVSQFKTGCVDIIRLKSPIEGHGGGDTGIMKDFIHLVENDGIIEGQTSAQKSVQSHIMAFAAEKARLENIVVDIDKYTIELKKQTIT